MIVRTLDKWLPIWALIRVKLMYVQCLFKKETKNLFSFKATLFKYVTAKFYVLSSTKLFIKTCLHVSVNRVLLLNTNPSGNPWNYKLTCVVKFETVMLSRLPFFEILKRDYKDTYIHFKIFLLFIYYS